jgi:hypothetical protein
VLGRRSDLRYLRWRLEHLLQQPNVLAMDEWIFALVLAACSPARQIGTREICDHQLAWYAERIEAARQKLERHYAEQHRLGALARTSA